MSLNSIEIQKTSSFESFSLYGWWRFNKRWLNLVWLFVIFSAVAYQTNLAISYNSNDTTNLFLIAARIGGFNLLIICALFWLPVMGHSVKFFQRSILAYLLPSASLKNIHKWLGHTFIALSVIHGGFFLLYMNTLKGPFISTVIATEADTVRAMKTSMNQFVSEQNSILLMETWVNQGYDETEYKTVIEPFLREDCTGCHSTESTDAFAKPSLPLTTLKEVIALSNTGLASRKFRINVTGLILLIPLFAIWVTSLIGFRNKQFPWFQKIHRLGYLIAVLMLLHIPRIEYLFVPTFLLGLEWILNRLPIHFWHSNASLTKISDDVVLMSIPLKRASLIPVGSIAKLRVKGLDKSEWHVMSVINSGNTVDAKFLIKSLGDWTSELQLSSNLSSSIDVGIRGFYRSPVAGISAGKPLLAFVGGIGITPLLSLLDSISVERPPKAITIIWVFSDWKLFEYLHPRLMDKQSEIKSLHLNFYATTPAPDFISENLATAVNINRPEIAHYIFEQTEQHPENKVAFVCGPKQLHSDVKNIASNTSNWSFVEEYF